MNKIMLEQSFTSLTELELANVGGGRIVWNGQINAEMHKVIDSSGNFSLVLIMLADLSVEIFTMLSFKY